MAIANSISQASIEQLDLILTCIASNARTIKTLSLEIMEHSANQEAAALADALECVASNIGYMAETGMEKLGSPRNSADHWFLPPLLQDVGSRDALKTAERQAGESAHHV